MAKTKNKKKKGKKSDIALDDFTEVQEVVEEPTEAKANPAEGMLSAKEAAAAIGTDARTLRKFLRKKSGTIGQGHRWLIDPDDLEELEKEFSSSLRKPRADEPSDEPKAKKKKGKKGKKWGPDEKTPAERMADQAATYGDPDDEFDEFEVLDEIDDL